MTPALPREFRSRRYVLRESPALGQVGRLADSARWDPITDSADTSNANVRLSWQMAPGVALSYSEHPPSNTSYVLATSTVGQGVADHAVGQLIPPNLDVVPDLELLADVTSAETVDEYARAVVRIGIGSPVRPDNQYSQVFLDAVRSVSPTIRMNGIIAIGFTEWEPFLELLQAVSQQDPEEVIRDQARLMTCAFALKKIGVDTR